MLYISFIVLGYIIVAVLFGRYYASRMINEFIENETTVKGRKVDREQLRSIQGLYAWIFGALYPVFMIELLIVTIKRRVSQ